MEKNDVPPARGVVSRVPEEGDESAVPLGGELDASEEVLGTQVQE